MYFTYILLCGNGSLYTGITTDLLRRFDEHAAGTGAKYTRTAGAAQLRCAWQSADRAAASRLEYRIKRLTRAQKLTLIETDDFSVFGDALDPAAYQRCPK